MSRIVVRAACRFALVAVAVAGASLTSAISAWAGAVVNDPNCATNTLAANDDGSTGQLALPFRLNFYGHSYSSLWVNNNGNVTFTGPLVTYTPFVFTTATPPIIAPFFADVDTRGAGSGLVTYGRTTYAGRAAFCVDWPHVGYYAVHTDKLNTFQLLLVDRSDIAAGDFEIVFNYNQIQWETGDASGGVGGLGGTPAGVGLANGDGNPSHFFALPGSLQTRAFLDSNSATGLIHHSHGTTVAGRYIFPIVNGVPVTSNPVTSNRYVVLGDSVPYGTGLVFEKNNESPSRAAYPQIVDQRLGLRPLNYRPTACSLTGPPGTYYDQLAVNGAPSIANRWTPPDYTGPRTGICGVPVHAAVFRDEVAAAGFSAEPPAMVTIQAGADDLRFSDCLKALLLFNIRGSPCVASGPSGLGYRLTQRASSELTSLHTGLSATVGFIHRYAPGAQIVLLDYYQLIPPAGVPTVHPIGSLACDGLRLATIEGRREEDRTAADFVQQKLNETIMSVASRYRDIIPIDISNLFYGHELCTTESWLYNSNNGVAHPTAVGHQKIAEAIVRVCALRPRRCVGR